MVYKMSINPLKTKGMLMGSNYRLNICQDYNVSSLIEMGVGIDNNLQWNSQIKNVCRKRNMKVNLLKRLSPFVTKDMQQLFYNLYILSQFH